MIYVNVACIAVSAYMTGLSSQLPLKVLNGGAALLNVAVVAAHIARLSA